MKVILLKDDKKLGKKYSQIEVVDSYAKNVLISKGIVIPATPDNINKINGKIDKEKFEYENKRKDAAILKNKIDTLKAISIYCSSSSTGKMFGAVTSKDISNKLSELGIEVAKQNIELKSPIKNFGAYTVTVKLFEDISTTITVCVINAFEVK